MKRKRIELTGDEKKCRLRLVSALADLGNDPESNARNFDFDLAARILSWADKQRMKRDAKSRLAMSRVFSDPVQLVKVLEGTIGSDASTLYAALFYSAFDAEPEKPFDKSFLDKTVRDFFSDDDIGHSIKAIIINALQIKEVQLIKPPAKLADIGEALAKTDAIKAQELVDFFILVNNTISVQPAYEIRAGEANLRLQDCIENRRNYTDQEFLEIIWRNDKFYTNFNEMLASEKMYLDPSYTPTNEKKGLYKLKTEIEDTLLRMVNPDLHKALRADLLGYMKGFEVGRDIEEGKLDPAILAEAKRATDILLPRAMKESGIPEDYEQFYRYFSEHLAIQMFKSKINKKNYVVEEFKHAEGKRPFDISPTLRSEIFSVIQKFIANVYHDSEREFGAGNKKFFLKIRDIIDGRLQSAYVSSGIPERFLTKQRRLKGVPKIARKIAAGRGRAKEGFPDDIHDRVGLRDILNISGMRHARLTTELDPSVHCERHLRGMAKAVGTNVIGRSRDYFTDDGAYAGQHITVMICGMRVEIIAVDSENHLNNCNGSGAHWIKDLVKPKEGEEDTGISMESVHHRLKNAHNEVMVRYADRLVALPKGATIETLTEKLSQVPNCDNATRDWKQARFEVINSDPAHRIGTWTHAPRGTPLRHGMEVRVQEHGRLKAA